MVNKELLEYFSNLLNKPVDGDTFLTLSSAQRVRVHAWLVERNIIFNEALLNQKFTVFDLTNKSSNLINLPLPNSNSTQDKFLNDWPGSLNVGIDIQEVKELFPQRLLPDPKSDAELLRIFTLNEISYAQSKHEPEITLTGIFAAKEALQKAGNTKHSLSDIEVLPDKNGRPIHEGYALSISHSGDYAVAIALQNQNQRTQELDGSSAPDLEEKKISSFFSSIRLLDLIYAIVLIVLSITILK